jgi:ArsR family transcriptional regulator
MQNFFIALADRTRRRILNLMRENEICVGDLTGVLDVSQPKISRHLAYLRNVGIVSSRRDGKWIYYRITEPEDAYAARVLQDTLDWLASQERMQKDYEKLDPSLSQHEALAMPSTHEPQPNVFPVADMYVEREELETYLL